MCQSVISLLRVTYFKKKWNMHARASRLATAKDKNTSVSFHPTFFTYTYATGTPPNPIHINSSNTNVAIARQCFPLSYNLFYGGKSFPSTTDQHKSKYLREWNRLQVRLANSVDLVVVLVHNVIVPSHIRLVHICVHSS